MNKSINLDIKTVVANAISSPLSKIDREKFLRKTLTKIYSEKIVEKAIIYTPTSAGIPLEDLDKIAKDSIDYEKYKVTIISSVAGIPGGTALLVTLPADLGQYFIHVFRIMQKLMYLYGWDNVYDCDSQIDDKTLKMLMIFLGVMYGVESANTVIKGLANTIAKELPKKIARKPLTKTIWYPIIKEVLAQVGIKVTKKSTSNILGRMVPIISAALAGTITYHTFQQQSEKLRQRLSELEAANIQNNK